MNTKLSKYILVILLSFIFITSCGKKQTEPVKKDLGVLDEVLSNKVLRVGTDFVGTPFAYYIDGKPTGFEVELMQEIGKKMGIKIEFIKLSFGIDNFINKLNNNEVDVIIESISRTPERIKQLSFASSYFNSGQAIVLRKDEKVPDLFELKLLKGKKIGVEKGTTGAKFAKNNTSGEIKEYENSDMLLNALMNGEVYAIISDILNTQTTGWPLWKKIKVVLKNLTHEEYCMVVKKGENALLERLNEELDKLKQDPIDGVYATLYRKWFY